jgi:UDP-GlcNAc:undecaprenyl-phosphate GlcNAc-1-phosphate transferase
MGVPIADGMFTITRRLLSKKSPFKHDRGHLHHLLLERGLDQRTIALIYWFMSIMLGLFALNLSSRGKLFAIILVLVVVGIVIVTLRFLSKKGIIEEHD